MEKTFMEAMDFRHACKVFDETKKVSDEDMNFILEAGRKSPSSFGMEGWKFLVITNEELKAKIRPVCWNQVQITSCSHLVIVLAAIDAVKPSSGEVERKFKRREMPQEKLDMYLGLYADHLKQTKKLEDYLESQYLKRNLVYGIHKSDSALMTCLILERHGKHIHFVDSSKGGYALASKELKNRLKFL